MIPNKSIILFDGVCNLCNSSVSFVIRRDKGDYFRFASLQSDAGGELLRQHNINPNSLESVILIEGEKVYVKSTAALRIARKLSWLWPMLYIFIILPPFFRNAVYNFIARNRYKWFGKRDSCWAPSAVIKEKFFL